MRVNCKVFIWELFSFRVFFEGYWFGFKILIFRCFKFLVFFRDFLVVEGFFIKGVKLYLFFISKYFGFFI